MVLCLFRQGYYILGIPLDDPGRLRGLENFRLSPSAIHPTLWKFSAVDTASQGHFLHFPNAMGNPLTAFHHADRLILCNESEDFMVLMHGYSGMIENFDPDELPKESHRFVGKNFNHFVRFFLKKTVLLNNSRVFLIEPEAVYGGYRHVLDDAEN